MGRLEGRRQCCCPEAAALGYPSSSPYQKPCRLPTWWTSWPSSRSGQQPARPLSSTACIPLRQGARAGGERCVRTRVPWAHAWFDAWRAAHWWQMCGDRPQDSSHEERELMMVGRRTRSFNTPRRTIKWTISKVECERFKLEHPSDPTKQPPESKCVDSADSVGRLDLYVDFCS